MSSLYQLTHQMEELMDSDEVTDEQLQETFGAIQQKAENICKYLVVLQGQADTFDAEIKRLTERKRALENQEKRIKEYIKEGMTTLGESKLQAGTFSISVSPSAGSVVIDDPAKIPSKFTTIVQTVVPNKAQIKEAIKAGEVVPGCYVKEGTTLKIR